MLNSVRFVKLSNISAGKVVNFRDRKCNSVTLLRLSNNPVGIVVNSPTLKSNFVRLPRSLNNPVGIDVKFLARNVSSVRPVRPSKSPTFTALLSLTRPSWVIAARCASVTSTAESTPGTASTMASRTSGVRALTDNIPPNSVNTSGRSADLTRVYPEWLRHNAGNVSISTETDNVVPGVRVTMKVSLSTLPTGIVMLVAPLAMLPFATLSGSTSSNGAPVGATALN